MKLWFSRFINPKSTITGEKHRNEINETLVLPLDRYENFLKEWILVGHKNDWNVYGQVKSLIDGGLSLAQQTVTWIGELMPWLEGAKWHYTWFEVPLDISRLQKNGYVRKRVGTVLLFTRSRFIL
jgi:methionyl-tRNA synthetase